MSLFGIDWSVVVGSVTLRIRLSLDEAATTERTTQG
jgi:hypothetical protein